MKSGGHFNELFDRWNDEYKLDTDSFTVACVGTKRVRYAGEAGEWTTDENEARVWNHRGACHYIGQVSEELFGYCRLVAVRLRGPHLPTVNGY